MAAQQTILVHMDRSRVWLFKAPQDLQYLDLPTTIMKDMEILNHDLFLKQFASFLSVHAVQSHRAFITVAESLAFVKDFSGMEPGKQEEAIKVFVENVPFDNVAKSQLHLDKVTRVIATNKDGIQLVKSALLQQKCEVVLALPIGAFQSISTQSGITPQVCLQLISAAEGLKEYNLLDPSPILSPLQSITENAADKKHPKRLPLLLGAFGGLIAILVSVIVVTNTQPTVPPSRAETLAPLPIKKISPTTAATATASATLSVLRVDVVQGTASASTAPRIMQALRDRGISDVRITTGTPTQVTADSQVSFSQTVTSSDQDQVMTILRVIDPLITSRVVAGLSRDIEIRLR